MSELLKGNSISDIPLTAQKNLEELLKRINIIRAKWGRPMTVTSGFRSMQHHIDIYRTIALRKKRQFSNLQVPMGSRHLTGEAVDIADPDGTLHDWCSNNVELLEQVGLWLEVKDSEPRVHFQSKPPRSGLRFFKP
jgi:hypothetical protein